MQNLDAMSVDELIEAADVYSQLAEYATYRRRAIQCRQTGNIAQAQRHEKRCEEIYSWLPKKYRW